MRDWINSLQSFGYLFELTIKASATLLVGSNSDRIRISMLSLLLLGVRPFCILIVNPCNDRKFLLIVHRLCLIQRGREITLSRIGQYNDNGIILIFGLLS